MKAKIVLSLTLICLMQSTWGTITWNGPITNSAIIDENINITGNCILDNSMIYIVADTADVTVTIKKNALIQAQENSQEITLVASWPYTITIKVEDDLEFLGVDNIETEPLYIYLFGDGEVRWEVRDGKKLSFNKTNTSGHTELWVGLFFNDPDQNNSVKQVFKLSDKRQLFFGPESLIGYAVIGNNAWTGQYEIQSSIYHQSSSKDYPHIIFDETSQFIVKIIDSNE